MECCCKKLIITILSAFRYFTSVFVHANKLAERVSAEVTRSRLPFLSSGFLSRGRAELEVQHLLEVGMLYYYGCFCGDNPFVASFRLRTIYRRRAASVPDLGTLKLPSVRKMSLSF